MLLVFGRTGQVAREIGRLPGGASLLGRDEADLGDPAACARAIMDRRPRAVINAAAWTAVDAAESDPVVAETVNAAAPAAMAAACADLGIPFVQISTDYVFDGGGTRPWAPGDPTGPLGVYGRTKLAGEGAVRAAGGVHAVLRTSWVYSAHGSNFLRTMLRLGAERDALSIVSDQIGGPTPAPAIAAACVRIAASLSEAPELTGTYHFTGAPDVSWADFARAIFAEARRGVTVRGIPTAEYPTPARRPLNSRMDCSATEAAFGIARPDWRASLGAIIAEAG